MTMEYLPTHMRATAYFLGILAGYLLYLERKGKVRVQLSKVGSADSLLSPLWSWPAPALLC